MTRLYIACFTVLNEVLKYTPHSAAHTVDSINENTAISVNYVINDIQQVAGQHDAWAPSNPFRKKYHILGPRIILGQLPVDTARLQSFGYQSGANTAPSPPYTVTSRPPVHWSSLMPHPLPPIHLPACMHWSLPIPWRPPPTMTPHPPSSCSTLDVLEGHTQRARTCRSLFAHPLLVCLPSACPLACLPTV